MSSRLTTQLLVCEQFDGSALCFPVADLSLKTLAADEDAGVTQLSAFLEEYLPRQRPEVQARFCAPSDMTLHEVRVPLALEDLPAPVQLPRPLALAVVVIPQRRDRWVVVPALGHTFHLGAGEELEAEVRREVRRVVTARQLSLQEVSTLFPPRAVRLVPVEVRLAREEGAGGRSRGLARRLARKRGDQEAARVLESVGAPLGQQERAPLPPLVAREAELAQLGALLAGEQRLSVMVVAPPLCGKTALIRTWAAGRRGGPVLATSAAQLVAGMSGLGQWQERVRRVMKAAARLDAVLYFDNLSELFGDHPGGMVDIAGALRPFLEEEKVRIVGELRPEVQDRLQARHPGFLGCLHRLGLEPLTRAQTHEALEQRVAFEAAQAPSRPALEPAALPHLLDLVERYLPYQRLPGKALAFLEELTALEEWAGGQPGRRIDENGVYRGFALRSGIPTFLLRQDQALKLEQVRAHLGRRVKGQQEAVARVAETLCVVKAGLQPRDKPLSSLLFIGPTGVGKTEVARALAGFLFGGEQRLVRFDMSEYADPLAAGRLIQGGERGEGELTRRVRQQPFCVVLLDEIEKAHGSVFDLLLGVLGEGRLTDTAGRTAYFHNAIVIMTSNLGAAHRRQVIGLEGREQTAAGYYMDQVRRAFRPEFVGRLDRVIPFSPLSSQQTAEVARLMLAKLSTRRGMEEAGVTLEVSDAAVDRLARAGTSEVYGARQLRRHLEDHLVTPLASLLARHGRAARGGRVEALLDSEPPGGPGRLLGEQAAGELRLRLVQGGPRRGGGAGRLLEVSARRREAGRLLRLPPVQEVREQLEYVVAQLATLQGRRGGRRGRTDPRASRELQELSATHRRLEEAWRGGEGLLADLASLEEMAVEAAASEEDLAPYQEESEQLLARLRGRLFGLLTVLHPRPGGITLLVQELDDGRGMDLWLLPLLEALPARRWSLTAHADGDRQPAEASWPATRRFGPPRDPAWLRQQLGAGERPFKAALLRVSGPSVGLSLALEAGLHVHHRPGEPAPARLLVRHLCPRVTLTDEEWLAEAIHPAPPQRAAALRRAPPARVYEDPAGPCLVRDRRGRAAVPRAQYWQRHDEVAAADLLAGLELGCEVGELVAGDMPLVRSPEGSPDGN